MKILHISSSDSIGGAAKSALNLHLALLNVSTDSVFFAAEKLIKTNKTIFSYKNGYLKRRILASIDSVLTSFYRNRTRDFPFTNNWFPFTGIIKEIEKQKPDIIHLHWVGKGMIRLEDITRLNIPIIWTMHDNYAFTGGCDLVNDCLRYLVHCDHCPQLQSNNNYDLSTYNFRRKKNIFGKTDITFVAPSKWMEKVAAESYLLKNNNVLYLPNLINGDEFYPLNKQFAKESIGIKKNTRIILFGAVNSTQDINKGFKELIGALRLMESDDTIELCVFGSDKPADAPSLPFKTNYMGYLNDSISKRILYSAADLVIVPSRIENLSNVIMEAMACGTPVVAFNTGGNSDLIDHMLNGYLAEKNNIPDLSEGIKWILNNSKINEVGSLARAKIENSYGRNTIVSRHLTLYNSLLSGR